MTDYKLYCIILVIFFSNFIRFTSEKKRLFIIRIIISYILLIRYMLEDKMIMNTMATIFYSFDMMVFALSNIAVFLLFILIMYILTYYRSAYSPALMPLSFLAGILSTKIVTDIYSLFDRYTIITLQFMSQILQLRYGLQENMLNNNLSILIFSTFTGLVEEFSKLALYIILVYFLMERKDKLSLIFYFSFTALGFTLMENMYYSLEFGHYIRIMRNIFAGHLIFSIFMGYFIYRAFSAVALQKKLYYLFYCFFFSVLIHSAWNFLSFVSMYNIYANFMFYIFFLVLSASGLYLIIRKENI